MVFEERLACVLLRGVTEINNYLYIIIVQKCHGRVPRGCVMKRGPGCTGQGTA